MDSLQLEDLDLKPVSTENRVHDALKKAENLVVDEDPDAIFKEYTLIQGNCPRIIQVIADALAIPFSPTKKFSIHSILQVLANGAFLDGQPLQLGDPDKAVLRCLCPRLEADEKSQGESWEVIKSLTPEEKPSKASK